MRHAVITAAVVLIFCGVFIIGAAIATRRDVQKGR